MVWYPCRDWDIRKSWLIWRRISTGRGGTYPETRYQTFCKAAADLVSTESDVIWVDKDKFHWDEKEILEYMLSVLKEHDILG